MSSNEAVELPPLSSWQVLSLRTTAFYNPDEKVDPTRLWFEIMESPPDTELRKPKEGIVHLEGPSENGKQSITTALGRTDFRLEGGEGGGNPSPLGSPEEVFPGFTRLSKSLLGSVSFPPASRLAFGTVMDLPVEDKDEGYRQLSAYLPFRIDASNSSDFFYRINRPRLSGTKNGLTVNRVSGWSLRIIRKTQLTLSPTGHLAASAKSTGPEYACRVELDINTDAEFNGRVDEATFDELVVLAKEIYARGDVP